MRIFSYVRDSVLFDATLDIRLSPAEVLRRRIVAATSRRRTNAIRDSGLADVDRSE
jgi:hypothetical protein